MRPVIIFAAAAVLAAPLSAQQKLTDTIRAGRYDLGRMWTFEYPPVEEFHQYGFTPDSAWFTRARMAALRIPGCSAGFVSADGLIITNHHCARGSIANVSRPGETLLDSGFVAKTLADERRIPNYYADQLIAVQDVSREVENALAAPGRRVAREQLRLAMDSAQRGIEQVIQQRLKAQYSGAGDSIWVQVVPLYSGARTSAYVFRRYTDIRLVVAAELQMGFFGGDWDNFTYPRYDLDFAILRAYDASGQPMKTPNYFGWGGTGAGLKDGDVVFVIGNPGQTSRLTTMSQLEWARDVAAPTQFAFLTSRHKAMDEYRLTGGAEAERYDIRNRMFGLSNSMKSLGGRIEALNDPVIMARRADAERSLRAAMLKTPAAWQDTALFARMAAHQDLKRRDAEAFRAFAYAMSAAGGSSVFQRAYLAWRAVHSADSADVYRQRLARVASVPAALEQKYLALQLGDIARAYGPQHQLTRAAIGGDTPEAAAARLLSGTALSDSAGARRAGAGQLNADPMMRLMDILGPVMSGFQQSQASIATSEAGLAQMLGRARFAAYGPAIPPDGSFSLRIADGVVKGYEYNGTWAAPFTSFYGLYDRYAVNGPGTDWDLPYRWRIPPAGLDLGTPLNFVSTADTYGGNSGSPTVTKDLRLVGLNFDRNVNALVRDYIYLPERGRNVMVDMRAVQAALEHVYKADRVAKELIAGRRVE